MGSRAGYWQLPSVRSFGIEQYEVGSLKPTKATDTDDEDEEDDDDLDEGTDREDEDDPDDDDDSDDDDDDDDDDDSDDEDDGKKSSSRKFKAPKTQAEFDRMIQKRIDRAVRNARPAIEKEIRASDKKAAAAAKAKAKPKDGEKVDPVVEELSKQLAALTEATQKAEQEKLRKKAADKVGITDQEAIDRIQGDTYSAMLKDARAVKKLMGTKADPETDDSTDFGATNRSSRSNKKRQKGAKPDYEAEGYFTS